MAVHLINRSLNLTLDGGILEEAWSGKKPSYDHLHVFGCEAYVHVPREKCSKLEPKSKKCIFVRYGESGEMGYRLWDLEARKIVHSSNVIFNEKKMHKQPLKEMKTRKMSCHLSFCHKGQMLVHQVCREKDLAMISLVQKVGLQVHQCRAKWCQMIERRLKCQLSKSQWY